MYLKKNYDQKIMKLDSIDAVDVQRACVRALLQYAREPPLQPPCGRPWTRLTPPGGGRSTCASTQVARR